MKGFSRDVWVVVLLNILAKPLWLIADNLAQDKIGHAEYGLIKALLGFGQWATSLSDWGMYLMVARRIAQAPQQYAEISSVTFSLRTLLSFAGILLFLWIGWLIGYRHLALLWLGLLLIYQTSISYLQFFRAFLQGFQRFRADAFFSAAEKALAIVFLALGWPYLSGHLYVGLLTLSGVIVAIVSAGWVWRLYGRPTWCLNPSLMWGMLQEITPFALMTHVTALNERINQVLLERWESPYANGLYWGAYRWFSAAMMYLWLVLPLFFARFARLGRTYSPELRQTFQWGQMVSALPIIGITGIFLCAPELFMLLLRQSTPTEQKLMSQVLQILALSLLLQGFFAIYSTYLTANGYERAILWIMVASTLANVASCAYLLPGGQALGAAWALALSYVVQCGGYLWVFSRKAPLRPPIGLLLRLSGVTIGYLSTLAIGRYILGLSFWGVLGLALVALPFWTWLNGLLRFLRYASSVR
ncbi:MAG: oligosaccharide flippase family protein [Bacteroidia bacterium]|nr:oligosaccharide flippase family protein [Bacteroidia bacterium]MDW8089220.1 oligosaccharide flippase family protein [Bacteroidia bacterium]